MRTRTIKFKVPNSGKQAIIFTAMVGEELKDFHYGDIKELCHAWFSSENRTTPGDNDLILYAQKGDRPLMESVIRMLRRKKIKRPPTFEDLLVYLKVAGASLQR